MMARFSPILNSMQIVRRQNSIDYFAAAANSIDINRLMIVASRGTASASELVTNGLIRL